MLIFLYKLNQNQDQSSFSYTKMCEPQQGTGNLASSIIRMVKMVNVFTGSAIDILKQNAVLV